MCVLLCCVLCCVVIEEFNSGGGMPDNVITSLGDYRQGLGSGVGGFCGYGVGEKCECLKFKDCGIEFVKNGEFAIGLGWGTGLIEGGSGPLLDGGIGGITGYAKGQISFDDVRAHYDCGDILLYRSWKPSRVYMDERVGGVVP